jgi:hypothetical protein
MKPAHTVGLIALTLAALAFLAGALNVPAEFGTPETMWPSAGWFFLTVWLIMTNFKRKDQ